MQPCNLSPTQSQTCLQFERTRPHTWVTHRMFGVQDDLPRVPFSRPSPWQLSDTPHSTFPPRVILANAVRGACMCVCVCWTDLKLCRVTKLVSGDILTSVYAQLSYTHRHFKAPPIRASSGRGDLDRHICCASPGFGLGSLKQFFSLLHTYSKR